MKVKCVKTSVNKHSDYIINSKMDNYLLVGSLFWVFGIRFFKNVTYIYIFNNEHLFEVPLELFEIVDDKFPYGWKIKMWDNDEITFWPDLFYEPTFLENLAERESDERNLFELLRFEMEK